MILISWFIIFLLAVSSAFADDSILADYGKTVAPMKTNEIQMVSEEIIIELDNQKAEGLSFHGRIAKVECTFLFKNNTDEEIKAAVGFPGNKQNTASSYSNPLNNFITIINDKQYDIKIKKEVIRNNELEDIQYFRNWYSWEMEFPPNSFTKVQNSYSYILGTNSGYNTFYLKYELSTGANWGNTIDTVTIRVKYQDEEDLEKRILEIKPSGWNKNKNEIVWKFTNIEPTEKDNVLIREKNIEGGYLMPNTEPLLFRSETE